MIEKIQLGRTEEEYRIDYEKLIEDSKSRGLDKKKLPGYFEKHHIIPRCLGGNDSDDNFVLLTAIEHIIAHILLYRIYPNDKKIIVAADCMLGLVSKSTTEREKAIKEINPEIANELRERIVELRKISVVCYKKITVENIERIEILKIFDSITSARNEGFSVGTSVLKNNGISGGYNWGYYSYIEEHYPDDLEMYLEYLEDGLDDVDLVPNKIQQECILKNNKLVCYKDEVIYRVYNKESDVVVDGFSVSVVSSILHGKYDGNLDNVYKWGTMSDLSKLPWWKDSYDTFQNLETLPEIVRPSTKVICCDKDFNIIKIYDSLKNVEEDRFKKPYICRLLSSKTKYGVGYYWYRMDDWILQDKLDEYYLKKSTGTLPQIKKINNCSKIQVVKCDLSNNVLDIYKSQHDVPNIKANSMSKVLYKDIKDREYKGFLWYRYSEFVDLFPTKVDYLEKVVDIIEDEEEPMMKILLTISGKLISVNDLYKARISYTAGGRPFPVVYKNPKAKEVSDEVRRQLLACDFRSLIPWLNRTKKYDISINFVLKTGITRRDCANFEKIMCDDLTRYIKNDLGIEHFDDSEFYECNFVKSIIPNAKHEYAYIVLKESYHRERLDLIEKPSRVYLGGQFFPRTNWRASIIPQLEKAGLEYYNPCNDIWNKEYRSAEKYKICDTVLYTLTPGDFNNKIACEIITKTHDTYYLGENQFILVAILGDAASWGDEFENIKYLDEETRKSSKIKFEYFNTTEEIVNYLKSLTA